jgi:phosphoribosyl-AMP cyclohydrolase
MWLKVRIAGPGVACHTGARSCFYRSVPLGRVPVDALVRPVREREA